MYILWYFFHDHAFFRRHNNDFPPPHYPAISTLSFPQQLLINIYSSPREKKDALALISKKRDEENIFPAGKNSSSSLDIKNVILEVGRNIFFRYFV